ncbi:MAG: SMC family ATPase [Gemmataceae bacterium]|nr:SMC family ATPase [Gemmataceae bacterium]MDW8264202.1 SMC family ATPase [Gemmataceae bacterium]
MIIKRIVLENFLTFGCPATEIVFSDDEPLWVLSGPNGIGKSAVFDAITYALFGYHRGGAQDADCLIRHGAKGFYVALEFEHDRKDYRIVRRRAGKATQRLECRVNDQWRAVRGVQTANELKAWVERTLGLDYFTFTASVLLRQGEADEFLTADGSRRLAILKKIIGLERYEALSQRVHEARRQWEEKLRILRVQRDNTQAVSDEDIQAAHQALAEVEAIRVEAQAEELAASKRLMHSERWEELCQERQGLEREVKQAQAREAELGHLRAASERLRCLQALEPAMRQTIRLGGELGATLSDLLAQLTGEQQEMARQLDQLTTSVKQTRDQSEHQQRQAREATEAAEKRRHEREHLKVFAAQAEHLANLRREWEEIPADVEARRARAEAMAEAAAAVAEQAHGQRAALVALVAEARRRLEAFQRVQAGVPCSLCGQIVSEEHARNERRRLTDALRDLEHRLTESENLARQAAAQREQGEIELRNLERLSQRKHELEREIDQVEKLLSSAGVPPDAGQVQRELAARDAEIAQWQDKAAAAQAAAAQATEQVRLIEHESARLAERLLQSLAQERAQLEQQGVVQRLHECEQDAVRADEKAQRLREIERAIRAIPPSARIPAAEAKRHLEELRLRVSNADKDRRVAQGRVDEVTRRAAEYHRVVQQLAEAELQAERHRKLDELLGRNGLQRDLVRSAEREIVHLANNTVYKLSDGDLSLELDGRVDGDDRALSLLVRRVGSSQPIPVAFLSGSQKFRVAIALALAIGRFASGQARPLESVIIDEGFGSLDRDGLRAAADELNRLRGYLRRIVLVSHQQEFAERFPVVIQLKPGENGTIAEQFRR